MSTHNIPFSKKKKKKKMKITLNYSKYELWDFSKELKNKFEPTVVNEPSVFDPLKFYCIFVFFSICKILNKMAFRGDKFTHDEGLAKEPLLQNYFEMRQAVPEEIL